MTHIQSRTTVVVFVLFLPIIKRKQPISVRVSFVRLFYGPHPTDALPGTKPRVVRGEELRNCPSTRTHHQRSSKSPFPALISGECPSNNHLVQGLVCPPWKVFKMSHNRTCSNERMSLHHHTSLRVVEDSSNIRVVVHGGGDLDVSNGWLERHTFQPKMFFHTTNQQVIGNRQLWYRFPTTKTPTTFVAHAKQQTGVIFRDTHASRRQHQPTKFRGTIGVVSLQSVLPHQHTCVLTIFHRQTVEECRKMNMEFSNRELFHLDFVIGRKVYNVQVVDTTNTKSVQLVPRGLNLSVNLSRRRRS